MKKILIVDDEPDLRTVAKMRLEVEGYQIIVGSNGQECLDLAQKEMPDLIILDIMMPVMDGYTATRRLRKEKRFKEMPILAMTANATVDDKKQALEVGMNAHISKPINPEELFRSLIQWIKTGERAMPELSGATCNVVVDEEPLLPESLPGISIEAGLKNLQGNRKLFKKLLKEFYQDHSQDISIIREAINLEELEKAQRIAHTIKGVAATMGAQELHKKAKELEAVIKQNEKASYNDLIDQMAMVMTVVIKGLAELDQQPLEPAESQSIQGNFDEIFVLLTKLEELLDEMDPAAEETVLLLTEKLGGLGDKKVMKKLSKQVNNFEFEEAIDSLAKLKELVLEEKAHEAN